MRKDTGSQGFPDKENKQGKYLARLKSLQEQYNAIHAVKPDPARKEYLDKRELELMQQADSYKKSIWELQSACNNLNRTVAALKEGLCLRSRGLNAPTTGLLSSPSLSRMYLR